MTGWRVARLFAAIAASCLMASCGGAPPEAEPSDEATAIPAELAAPDSVEIAEDAESLGTPREDRVATLGLINKRNNVSRDIEIRPGEAKRVGNVVMRLATCERTPPWEAPAQTGAFVQVIVQQRQNADEELTWQRVFSGWLFKESPGVNVVEHPVYDVWVKDCAMSFPGEEASDPEAEDEDAETASDSNEA